MFIRLTALIIIIIITITVCGLLLLLTQLPGQVEMSEICRDLQKLGHHTVEFGEIVDIGCTIHRESMNIKLKQAKCYN